MLKSIAISLLKLLLSYLGSDLNREASEQLAAYNRKREEAEAERTRSQAEIEQLEKNNAWLEDRRRELATKRILLDSEILEINKELEKKELEKADKLRRIDDLSDSDILRAEF